MNIEDLAARLHRELAEMRRGVGLRRAELRERMNLVDAELVRRRNVEAIRLADTAARQRAGRGDAKALALAVQSIELRLAGFDRQIVDALIKSEPPPSPAPGRAAPSPVVDGPATTAEARAAARAKLLLASATLAELLPEAARRQVVPVISRALRRLR